VKAVRIRTLIALTRPLNEFDPGANLSALEFCETTDPISDAERDGLAQLVHFLAFIALKHRSTKWQTAMISRGTDAFHAIQPHVATLEGCQELAGESVDLLYSRLAKFLIRHFPPRAPK
jgi:hypothetical protein